MVTPSPQKAVIITGRRKRSARRAKGTPSCRDRAASPYDCMRNHPIKHCPLLILPVLLTGVLLAAAGCDHKAAPPLPSKPSGTPVAATNAFVGSAACAECHPRETQAHAASRHAVTLRSADRQA